MSTHGAFSEEEVSSLTGLSQRQLRYWDSTGFFRPSFRVDSKRVYSFRDLVGLRAIAPIRQRLSLQSIREISHWLNSNYEAPWSSLRFYLAGDDLVFAEPDSQDLVSTKYPGQEVMEIDLDEIRNQTIRAVERRQRNPDQLGQVVRFRDVMRNSPVLAGTRVTTRAIYDFHASGCSPEEILFEYPGLSTEDIEAAIRWEQERTHQAG